MLWNALPPGVGGVEPPNCFLNLFNTLSNYVQGGQLRTDNIWLHHNFVRFLTVEKFNLPADFFTIQTLSTNDNSYPYIFQILFSQHV